MRKLAIPFGAVLRRRSAEGESQGYDNEDKRDCDSFGSLPKGEVSRRLRYGNEARKGRAGSPMGLRLRLDGMGGVSATSNRRTNSTIGRAAVATMPRRRRHVARDPPSRDGVSEPECFRQHSPMGHPIYEETDMEYPDDVDGCDIEIDERMHEEQHFQDYDEFAGWSDSRRQTRMVPRRETSQPRKYVYHPSDSWSAEVVEERQWEDESDGRGYSRLDIRESVGGINRGSGPVRRLPRQTTQPPQPQMRTRSYMHRDSLSDSMASSMSSGAPIYTPEDSRFLLAENEGDDWAELPTHRDDPELREIRKQFLRQDTSTVSSNGSLGNSTLTSRSSKLRQANRDTEGLPDGFYRRKDGVILSMESSVGSSTNRQSTRYTNSITEASAIEATVETRETNKYAMDVSDIEEENSIIASTLTETIVTENDSKHNINDGQRNGLVAAFAQSFEDQIYYIRTGKQRDPTKVHKTPLNTQRAKVKGGSAASSTSTPSSVRKAKVKHSAHLDGQATAKTRHLQKVPPLPSTTQDRPPVPLGMQNLDEQTSGSEYDDSTITTKDTAMQAKRAIIDTSRIPEEDRAVYLRCPSPQDPPTAPIQPARRKEVATDSIDLAKRQSDRKTALAVPSDDGYFHSSKTSQKSKKTVGFAGAYPEPTRRGDRVPELISPSNGATNLPSVVSDISSLPRPKSKESFFDMSSKNGYGGFTVEDNITGFIDKMAVALRQAVFQQAKGCTGIKK